MGWKQALSQGDKERGGESRGGFWANLGRFGRRERLSEPFVQWLL